MTDPDPIAKLVEDMHTALLQMATAVVEQTKATIDGLFAPPPPTRVCNCDAPEGAYHRRTCPKSGWFGDPMRGVLDDAALTLTYRRDLDTGVTRNPAQDAPRSARMPKHIDQQVLTVVGDRQHGKSHLLMLAAIDEAANGREQVWWECEGPREARERFHSTTRTVARGNYDPVKVIDRNGRLELQFTGGGRIRVFGEGRPVELVPTVHLLDGVTAQPYSGVKRVIRTVLR